MFFFFKRTSLIANSMPPVYMPLLVILPF
uniref:Uncharacterized protein n=1 Tax=Arundo donax TaxID=35708 RepID=A0A0A9F3S6_ARUDO